MKNDNKYKKEDNTTSRDEIDGNNNNSGQKEILLKRMDLKKRGNSIKTSADHYYENSKEEEDGSMSIEIEEDYENSSSMLLLPCDDDNNEKEESNTKECRSSKQKKISLQPRSRSSISSRKRTNKNKILPRERKSTKTSTANIPTTTNNNERSDDNNEKDQKKDMVVRGIQHVSNKEEKEADNKAKVIKKPKKKPNRTKKTCPKCGNKYDDHGYKYHIKNKVCERKLEKQGKKRQFDTAGGRLFPELEDKSRPFCFLPSYFSNDDTDNDINNSANRPTPNHNNMEFSTPYGIVRIIKDERFGTDFGSTTVDLAIQKPEYQRRNLWKLRTQARKNATKLREYQKWLKRRKWIDVLYQHFIYPRCKMSLSCDDDTCCTIVGTMEEKEDAQLQFPLPGIIAGEQISIFKLQSSSSHQQEISIFMNRNKIETAEEQSIPTLEEEKLCQSEEYPSKKYIYENVLHPKDSYPDRMIECILVPDERTCVLVGQNHPDEIITHYKDQQQQEPFCKLYIQRKVIQKMYLNYQKKYICYDCGFMYGLRNNLTNHVKSGICMRKKSSHRIRPCDILQENDVRNYRPILNHKKRKKIQKRLLSNQNVDVTVISNTFEKDKEQNKGADDDVISSNNIINEASSEQQQQIYHSSKVSIKNQKQIITKKGSSNNTTPINIITNETSETVPHNEEEKSIIIQSTQQQQQTLPNNNTIKKKKKKKKKKRKRKKKKKPLIFPPLNSMYHPLFAYLGYQRKQMVILKTITTKAIYNQVFEFLHFRQNLRNGSKRSGDIVRRLLPTQQQQCSSNGGTDIATKPKKRKRIYSRFSEKRMPKNTNNEVGLIDMRVLIQEIDSGRYPSMQTYTQQHQDKLCYICHNKTSTSEQLYPCKCCYRCCHVDCVYKKRPFIGFDGHPSHDTFMCHVCIGFVVERRATAHKVKLKRMELLLGSGTNTRMRNVVDYKGGYAADDDDDDDDVNNNLQHQEEDEQNVGKDNKKRTPEKNEKSSYNNNVNTIYEQGKEMNELEQLATYTRLKLKREIYISNSNNARRSMMF